MHLPNIDVLLMPFRTMENDDWDAEIARVAFTQQLQDIGNALRTIPESSKYAATLRNEAAAINLQMQEVEALEARRTSQRMQHSMYRAMLSDLPQLGDLGNRQGSTPVRRRGQGRAGETGNCEDCRVNPDGSTRLEDYIERLKLDEQARRECYICADQVLYSESVVFGECPHSWCHGCLRRAFDLAIKSHGGYPVRCCVQIQSISLDNPDVALALGDKMISDAKAKIMEYTPKIEPTVINRHALPSSLPDTISDRMATCPTCQQRTCASCKGPYHEKPDCSAVNDEAFEHWRDENGAATCPGCHHAVEITYGCNHMKYALRTQNDFSSKLTHYCRCLCGMEFCYECSVTWKNCSCSRWHVDRLYDRAAQVAERQGRPANTEQVARELQTEEDCRHNEWTRSDLNRFAGDERYEMSRCRDCGWHANDFLWQCDGRAMRVCSRCRRDYRDFDHYRDEY